MPELQIYFKFFLNRECLKESSYNPFVLNNFNRAEENWTNLWGKMTNLSNLLLLQALGQALWTASVHAHV